MLVILLSHAQVVFGEGSYAENEEFIWVFCESANLCCIRITQLNPLDCQNCTRNMRMHNYGLEYFVTRDLLGPTFRLSFSLPQ